LVGCWIQGSFVFLKYDVDADAQREGRGAGLSTSDHTRGTPSRSQHRKRKFNHPNKTLARNNTINNIGRRTLLLSLAVLLCAGMTMVSVRLESLSLSHTPQKQKHHSRAN
jgi:hypothetical protein